MALYKLLAVLLMCTVVAMASGRSTDGVQTAAREDEPASETESDTSFNLDLAASAAAAAKIYNDDANEHVAEFQRRGNNNLHNAVPGKDA
jgi:hypothetical protein